MDRLQDQFEEAERKLKDQAKERKALEKQADKTAKQLDKLRKEAEKSSRQADLMQDRLQELETTLGAATSVGDEATKDKVSLQKQLNKAEKEAARADKAREAAVGEAEKLRGLLGEAEAKASSREGSVSGELKQHKDKAKALKKQIDQVGQTHDPRAWLLAMILAFVFAISSSLLLQCRPRKRRKRPKRTCKRSRPLTKRMSRLCRCR